MTLSSDILEGRTYKQDPDGWEKNGCGACCEWESPLRGNVFSQESKPTAQETDWNDNCHQNIWIKYNLAKLVLIWGLIK